ncbi:T9SS type A sorting domain-containing protein [Algibacter lectus]|uniref:Putative secreted protein (Por secretion system target) n=1 Tax=Algibacter lectus TaxID=221126 RepID=A0A4R8M9W2_9FLAO|nr:T9SS type A sorting domain-containing protein [Algibacter lectus]MWW25722.1 T9SS type A sorting domain-containing protein [Algibacter lectus]TDY61002.1 putative secreted protein (Por secretion system target) [Algibacter lectus]
MKHIILLAILTCSLNCFSQFGADYSSYGFNFVNDTYNDGLKNWTGTNINDSSKFNLYKQDVQNNYALELKPVNETLSINYNDFGYMDLNPCAFKINIRVRVNQYSGDTDKLSFSLFTGAKKVELQFTSSGIYYANSTNTLEFITSAPTINQWITYSLALDSCSSSATLMLENDAANAFTLNLPDNTTAQNINLEAFTDSNTTFSSEIDHLFIYSNPIKWWLGPSTAFVDDTPAGYTNTTGDRQHFLALPNGEKIGLNENGGGYITFTELTPGGPNLDPFPKFGSGGTKTLRGYFHTSNFNPVQAGISSTSGGHLVNINTTANKVEVERFPLHSYIQDDFTENTPLIYPNNETLGDENDPAIIDDDVYDEFGLDMRHELMCELDFNTSIENVTKTGSISTVRHIAEWEYIRHPSFILQFHEVNESVRPDFETFTGANNDMGEMRHKFEFRLNKDLGYQWILWRDSNNAWQSLNVTAVGDSKKITIRTNTALEKRFLVFSTSSDPDAPGAVSWFYPESDYNTNSTLGKSRTDKTVNYTHDRRTSVTIVADWRKTNWCRMNLYIRNEGLIAPSNGDPNIYEAFQMEALQLFGTPNEILDEVMAYDDTLVTNAIEQNTATQIFPNPFANKLTITGKNLLNKEVKLYSMLGRDISSAIEFISRSNTKVVLRINNLNSETYFLKVGNTTRMINKLER